MGTVLQILGLVFLVIVAFLLLVVVLVVLKMRSMVRTLKGTLEGLQVASAPAPPRLHLVRMPAPSWDDDEAVAEAEAPLPKLGFTPVGHFHTQEVEGLKLDAWVQPSKGLTAIVYEHPIAGVWLDLVSHFEDGSRLTYANIAQGGGVEHAPGNLVERFAGMTTEEMYHKLLAERPDKPLKPVAADEFVAAFQKAYADEMDWRNSRGGPSGEEIRRVAALSGEEYTEDQIEATRARLEYQALTDLVESLRERFVAESKMSGVEWERVRDRLVFIHDRLTPELLDSSVSDWMDEEEEMPPSEMPDATPRYAFARFNKKRPEAQRFRKLGELKEPIEADVYCGPEN